MGLFSRHQSQAADSETAQGECARLAALPSADLAAAILPAFAPDSRHAASGPIKAAEYLVRSYPGGIRARCVRDLREPVGAAIQLLQGAGLVVEHARGGGAGAKLQITDMGRAAIQAGDTASLIRQRFVGAAAPAGADLLVE
jgi:hypothetical protein